MNRVLIDHDVVGDIPLMTMAKESAGQRPLVFFIHGFTCDKRQGLELGYALARRGFHFVAFDAPMHGERFDERLGALLEGAAAYVYPRASGLDVFLQMHRIIVQIAEDVAALIAHFDGVAGVDTSWVGVTGFSMGGFATFYAAAHNPRIRAAVPIAGIPGFGQRWRDVVLESSSYPQWAPAMAAAQAAVAEHAAFMDAIDPFDKLASFSPRPLMMICGDRDLDSPKKYSVDLYRALQEPYAACPQNLRLNIHDEAGHQLTRRMIEDVCAWFAQHRP